MLDELATFDLAECAMSPQVVGGRGQSGSRLFLSSHLVVGDLVDLTGIEPVAS
jgi:hypothetical protein